MISYGITEQNLSDMHFEASLGSQAGDRHNIRGSTMELNIAKYLFKTHKDYINFISVEDLNKAQVVIGTEKGIIIVFSLQTNKTIGCFQADQWVSSMKFRGHSLYVSGKSRVLQGFHARSGHKEFSLAQEEAFEAYGTAGIKIQSLAPWNRRGHRKELMIINSGFCKFKIINSKTKKVLSAFDLDEHLVAATPNMHQRTRRKVIMNYCVISDSNLLCTFLEAGDSIQIFDFKLQKMAYRLQLYDRSSKPDNTLLINTMLMERSGILFVLLQFTNNQNKPKITTIIYVIRRQASSEFEFLFYKNFSKVGSYRKPGHDGLEGADGAGRGRAAGRGVPLVPGKG